MTRISACFLTTLILSLTPLCAHSAQDSAVDRYERRIRQALTPEEVRLACSAPAGSITRGQDIIVCAERDPNLQYRVPGDPAPPNPETDSPAARAEALLREGDTPTGPGADKPKALGDPVKLLKTVKKLLEAE